MTIYEQLREYCECVEDISNKDIDELVDIVSMASCWCNSPCETFLMSSRKEIIELPQCENVCCDNIYEFRPFYHPFDEKSFTFKVIKQKGLEEEEVETEIVYSETDEVFKVKLLCECGSTYKLIATYDAGYELIPECLLPVFCEIIDLIKSKNTCECEGCQSCGSENPNNQIDYGVYPQGDLITASVKAELTNILAKQYIKQIGLISLCDNYNEMWAVIV